MGTSGLFAIRYKGEYYIQDHHYDSHPEGLGQNLVNSIPISQEEFEEWLQVHRNSCEKMKFSGELGDYKKSTSPPAKDGCEIKWTYTYDLDNLAFVIDSQAHFCLRTIAQKPSNEWTQFLSSDARGERCLSLDTPPSLIAQLLVSRVPFLGRDPVPAVDGFSSTSTLISPSTWSQPLTPHHRRLMLAQVNLTIAETYSTLSLFHMYSASSLGVQRFAMSFLEAIVPNNQAIVANRRSPAWHFAKPKIRGSPWFWYRGCLILFAPKLEDNELFQVYVRAVSARVKAKNLDKCTALLWSVCHVAVVEISRGSVSHSDPMPLLAAYNSDEEGFVEALHLLWYYLPYPRWRIVDASLTSQGAARLDFGGLPIEIVMRVMAFTDQLHYPKYQFLSHSFFKLWWTQLRIGSYTILPDNEEIGKTSRHFSAYSADENAPVKLRLKVLWGKKTGSIWLRDDPDHEPATIWHHAGRDPDDFSRDSSSNQTVCRLQRCYDHWPEAPCYERMDSKFRELSGALLTRVPDEFSSQSDILRCEVLST